ncbi:MAG: hypothetical protein SXQ77_11100 [Halobacteria archaeon]|nr:hypothetical protein [Halobacteria archaeon]
MNEQLERKWDRTQYGGGGGYGTRRLARQFNTVLVKRVAEENDIDSVELGEASDRYNHLRQDTNASPDAVTNTERLFTTHGFDPDELREDFVSHQTIYNHLTRCLDIEIQEEELSKQEILDAISDETRKYEKRIRRKVEENDDKITRDVDFDDLTVKSSRMFWETPDGEVYTTRELFSEE